MGDAKRDNSDTELTSTMGNVLSTSIKEEKSDTGDATPTSSTDASTTATSSKIVSDDPISSTSSDVVDFKKVKTAPLPSVSATDDDAKVSSMEQEADLLEMSITEVTTERITEDVEDLVHDLESLLGEPAEVYIAQPKERSSEEKDTPEASVAESDSPLENAAVLKDAEEAVTPEGEDTGCDRAQETGEVIVEASQQVENRSEKSEEANTPENVSETEKSCEEQSPNDSEAEPVESALSTEQVQMEDTETEEAITVKESQVDSSEDGTENSPKAAEVVGVTTDKDCASSSNETKEVPSKADVEGTEDTEDVSETLLDTIEIGHTDVEESADIVEANLEAPVEERKEVDGQQERNTEVIDNATDTDNLQSNTVETVSQNPVEIILEQSLEETNVVEDDKPEETEKLEEPSEPNETCQDDIPHVDEDGIVEEAMETDQEEEDVGVSVETVADVDRSLDDPERTQTASISLENLEDSTDKSQEDLAELPLEKDRSETKTEEEIEDAELEKPVESGEQHDEQKQETEKISDENMDTEETRSPSTSEEPKLVPDAVEQAPDVSEAETCSKDLGELTESAVDQPELEEESQKETVAEESQITDDIQPETSKPCDMEQVAVDSNEVVEAEDTLVSPKSELEVVPQTDTREKSDDSAAVVEEPEQEIEEEATKDTLPSVVDEKTEDTPPKSVEEMEIGDDLPESQVEHVEIEESPDDVPTAKEIDDEKVAIVEDVAGVASTEICEIEASEQSTDTVDEMEGTQEDLHQTESSAEIQDVAATTEQDSTDLDSPKVSEQTTDMVDDIKETQEELHQTESPAEIQDVATAAERDSTDVDSPEVSEQTMDTEDEVKETREESPETESSAEIQDVPAPVAENSPEKNNTLEESTSIEIKNPDQEINCEETEIDKSSMDVDMVEESSEVMAVEEIVEESPLQSASEEAKEPILDEATEKSDDVDARDVQPETSHEKSEPEIDDKDKPVAPVEDDSQEKSCIDVPEAEEVADTMPAETDNVAQESVSDSPEEKTEELEPNTEKDAADCEKSPEVDLQPETVLSMAVADQVPMESDGVDLEEVETKTAARENEAESEVANSPEKMQDAEPIEETTEAVQLEIGNSEQMDQPALEIESAVVSEKVETATGEEGDVLTTVADILQEEEVDSTVDDVLRDVIGEGEQTIDAANDLDELEDAISGIQTGSGIQDKEDDVSTEDQAEFVKTVDDNLIEIVKIVNSKPTEIIKTVEQYQAEVVKTVDDELTETINSVGSTKSLEDDKLANIVKTVDDEISSLVVELDEDEDELVPILALDTEECTENNTEEIPPSLMETTECEEVLEPVSSFNEIEKEAAVTEPVLTEKERMEMEALRKAVESITGEASSFAAIDDVVEDVSKATDILVDQQNEMKAIEDVEAEKDTVVAPSVTEERDVQFEEVVVEPDKSAGMEQADIESVVDEKKEIPEADTRAGVEEVALTNKVDDSEVMDVQEIESDKPEDSKEDNKAREVANKLTDVECKPKEVKLKPEEAELQPEEAELQPEEAELTPEETELKPKKAELKPKAVKLKPEEVDLKPEQVELKPEEVELKPEEVKLKPKEVEMKPKEVMLKLDEIDSLAVEPEKPALRKAEDSGEKEAKAKSVPKVLEEVGKAVADSAQEISVKNNLVGTDLSEETVPTKSDPRVGRARKELSSVKNSISGKEEASMRLRTRRSASRNKKSQKTEEVSSNSVVEEAKQNAEEEDKMHLPDSSVEVQVMQLDKDVKPKPSDRPKRHKKAGSEKLEELSINVDVPDKEKPYSPKITIKPIKTPEEEVSTTSNSDSENQKGSLKITITKQSDKMHSILKVCDSDNSESVHEEEAEPVPKLKIKNIGQPVEQIGGKMSTRSSKHLYSPTSSGQRASSPRITIKIGGLKAEEKTSPKLLAEASISPKKVIIKPVVKPPAEDTEQPQVHSPRITIKPIPKPETEKETPLKISTRKKNDEDAVEQDKGRSSPKVTIKPVVKPASPEVQADGEEEVKERIVLKINKGNLPTPTKDNKKREPNTGDDEKSDNWARITVKFSKEGGHPHIVQQNDDSHKRPHEEAPSEKTKKQKVDGESSIATRTRHKDLTALETSDGHASKHKETSSECPVESKKLKLLTDDVSTTDDDVHIVETKLNSPIVISEDSRSQDSCVIVEETKQSPVPKQMSLQEGINNPKASPLQMSAGPKKRGRPRKVPLVVREDFKEVEEPAPEPPAVELPSPVHESGRPKRSCRGQSARDTLGIKPRKPRGGGRGRGSKRGMGNRPETDRGPLTQGLLTFEPMQTDVPEKKAKTLLGQPIGDKALITIEEVVARAFQEKIDDVEVATEVTEAEVKETVQEVKETVEEVKETAEEVKATAEEVKETAEEVKETAEEVKEVVADLKEVTSDDSSVTVPLQPIRESSDSQILLSHDVSSTSISSEVVMVDEDTRMSAETNSRSQTPAKQMVAPGEAVIEESQSSMQSSATTESGKTPSSKSNRGTRLEVTEPDAGVIAPEQLSEYYWNGSGPFMLQEQVAQYLGIKSFKRKYPSIKRRTVDMQERDYIKEHGLASEHMCDLGLTAVNSTDILDIMYSDFQEKYEEYCKHQRDRQAKELISKQKALSLAVSQEKSKADMTDQAVQSAMQWNAMFNKTRREQRKACMDLQTYTIHYPKGRIKEVPKAKVGNYPVALVPGQFMDYYAEYTPTEINNLPINTMLYEPINIDNTIHESEDTSSDGSSSDSDSSSSSSGSDSDSSSGIEDCKLCKHSSGGGGKKIAATK